MGDKSELLGYGKHQNAALKKGLLVKLAEGESLHFEKPIDVSTATREDVFLEMFATPETSGLADCGRFWVTLTDAEDPNVYLKISITDVNTQEPNFARAIAGGNGQALAGYDGAADIVHVNQNGTPFRFTFNGSYFGTLTGETYSVDKYYLDLRYDDSELALYNGCYQIAEMDNPKFFADLWSGFPSGKAYLSVSAEDYSNKFAYFCISKVHGLDLASYADEQDDAAPDIYVDYLEGELPVGLVGARYTVPTATAYDDYAGKVSTSTYVYYEYASESPVFVPVENGTFTPTREGTYSLVYTAVDDSGNEAKKILSVKAVKSLPQEKVLQIGIEDETTVCEAGELVEVPVPNVDGGSGTTTYRILLKTENETREITQDCSFIAERVGKGAYTVEYVVRDFIGQQKTLSYTVDVSVNTKPVFSRSPDFPTAYLSTYGYTVPTLTVDDYATGEKQSFHVENVKISYDGKVSEYKTGDAFVAPEIKGNGDYITFIYEYDGTEKEYEVFCAAGTQRVEQQMYEENPETMEMEPMFDENGNPVMEYVKQVQLQNYFIGSGIRATRTPSGVQLLSQTQKGEWTFARELLASELAFSFAALPSASLFDGIAFTLTDFENRDIAITFRILARNTASVLQIENVNVSLAAGFSNTSQENTFSVSYENGKLVVGSAKIPVSQTDKGTPFNGFPSHKVLLSAELINGSVGGGYEMISVNNQNLSATTDSSSPQIQVLGEDGTYARVGSVYTVSKAIAMDVVDPTVSLTLTVEKPNGQVAMDVNGKMLRDVPANVSYEVRLSDYGDYEAVLTATDTSGKYSTLTYGIYVLDEEAPQISFNGTFAKTAKRNETVVLPTYTVSDNLTATDKIVVSKFVLAPNGYLHQLENTVDSFVAKYAGTYEIRIMVYDESGNVTVVSKYVIVE